MSASTGDSPMFGCFLSLPPETQVEIWQAYLQTKEIQIGPGLGTSVFETKDRPDALANVDSLPNHEWQSWIKRDAGTHFVLTPENNESLLYLTNEAIKRLPAPLARGPQPKKARAKRICASTLQSIEHLIVPIFAFNSSSEIDPDDERMIGLETLKSILTFKKEDPTFCPKLKGISFIDVRSGTGPFELKALRDDFVCRLIHGLQSSEGGQSVKIFATEGLLPTQNVPDWYPTVTTFPHVSHR